MTAPDDPALGMLHVAADTARGPRREGAFALWLTLRVATDLTREDRPSERAHRRRVLALEQRLSSLTMPPPLRRALQGVLLQLRAGEPQAVPLVLAQLVAPAREALGPEALQVLLEVLRTVPRRGAGPGRRG